MGTAQAQAQLWGRYPQAWSQTMEQQVRPLYRATLDALASLHGRSLLDAGCGSGQAIADAASRGAAVCELARVCRAGGQVAIGIWGDPLRCETEGLFQRLRSLAPPPPGTPAPLGCSDAGVVEDLLTKAGLSICGGGEVPIAITFDRLDEAWEAHRSSGPLQKVIDAVGEDSVREVIDAVLTADRKPDGKYRQDNVMRYVLAAQP